MKLMEGRQVQQNRQNCRVHHVPSPPCHAEDRVSAGFGVAVISCTLEDDRQQLGHVRRSSAEHPLLWFLPGAERMRGGAARQFASDWIPHRGIHLEATPNAIRQKVVTSHVLAKSRSWRGGFPTGIHPGQFLESTWHRNKRRISIVPTAPRDILPLGWLSCAPRTNGRRRRTAWICVLTERR